MKVTRTQENLFVSFEELLDYKIFSDADDWIYLKIPTLIDKEYHRVNAIDLENDCLAFFEDDDKIKIRDSEVIIRD